MNKFGWFMCGVFGMVLWMDVIFSMNSFGSADKRVLMFILALIGIGLILITQKEKKQNEN